MVPVRLTPSEKFSENLTECSEVVQALTGHFVDDGPVEFGVFVNEDIAEPNHLDPVLLECFVDETVFVETVGNVPADLDGTELFRGNDIVKGVGDKRVLFSKTELSRKGKFGGPED